MTNTPSTPQTVSFEIQLVFGNAPTPDGSLKIETRKVELFELFEDLGRIAYKERHRRAKVDRATSVRWKTVLTAHGREVYRERFGSLSGLDEKLGVTLDEWKNW